MKKSIIFIKVPLFILIVFFTCLIGLYVYAYVTPPINLKNNGKIYIYDNKDNLVFNDYNSNAWISLDDIDKDLINAVLSVEDKNFYSHNGFDYIRIAKAIFDNVRAKEITSGASTITQQYAKNMYLNFDKTWGRKIEEAFLTLELEVHYSKDDILEGYLNTIYYGHGNYGVESASKYYFNKSSKNLTLEEALILAGIPNRPNDYNPESNYDNSIKRAKIVALTMVNNKLLDKKEYDNLFKDKIDIYAKNNKDKLQMIMYYQDAVLNELKSLEQIPKSLIESGGLNVYTTLDFDIQKKLEKEIIKYLPDDEIQVSSVITNPNTGGIVALTGGVDYSKSNYNRALYSKRQVGSTMKPFLYYAALENNFTSASTFTSEHTVFYLSNNSVYSPSNYSGIYANKDITMASAIAFSDNIYAVKTNMFLGADEMIKYSKEMGILGKLSKVPSLALGTSELNILDLTMGYNTLASGGFYNDLHFITKVEDINGQVLYEKNIEKNLVLNPNNTYILNEMLTGTYSDLFMDYTSSTALSIKDKLTKKYAFKSGTTDTDNWSIGYNNEYLMSIWMGYDENKKTNTTNSKASKLIWANTMEKITTKDSWYTKPDNVVGLLLDSVTGKIPSKDRPSTIFYFTKGTEPIN